MRAITALAVLLAAAAVAGCGSDGSDGPITVYSGREEELAAEFPEAILVSAKRPEDVAREVKSFIGDMRMQLSLYKYQY